MTILESLVAAGLAGGLALLAAPASACAVTAADACLEQAAAAYERGHWQEAFDGLARLADAGHADTARQALLMWRHGMALYGVAFDVPPARARQWVSAAATLALRAPRVLADATPGNPSNLKDQP